MQLINPELIKRKACFFPVLLSRSQPHQSLGEYLIRNSTSKISEDYSHSAGDLSLECTANMDYITGIYYLALSMRTQGTKKVNFFQRPW